jgi:hypothetical protein
LAAILEADRRLFYSVAHVGMKTNKIFLIGYLLAILFQFGCSEKATKEEMLRGMPADNRRALESMDSTPMVASGIDRPLMLPADSVSLLDSDKVIGVVVEGAPRAYPLKRMSSLLEHVVNDHVVDRNGKSKAFTVTYCNVTECIRVLHSTSDGAVATLGIGTLGLVEGQLALFRGTQTFKQDESIVGLLDMEYEVTSWSGWKLRFPETLVYVGPASQVSKSTGVSP